MSRQPDHAPKISNVAVPSFIESIDQAAANQDRSELQAIATMFGSLIDDSVLNFPNDTVQSNIGLDGSHESLLLKRGELPKDSWSVILSTTKKDDITTAQTIELIGTTGFELGAFGGPSERVFSYRLDAEGIVRRWDTDGRTRGLGKMMLFHSLTRDGIANDEALKQEQQNSELEKQLGVNAKAITLQELNGLTAFVQQAQPSRL